jgi:phosphoglycerate dehydrogenase-like enzyme
MPPETNVLFIWNVNQRLRNYLTQRLKQAPHVNLMFPPQPSQAEYVQLAPEAHIIVGWRPTKELLDAAQNLQLFINPGAGVQHLIELFVDVSRTRTITLTNCHGNAAFVAQHAVALLLALTNKVVLHHNWMAQGEWRKGDADAKSTPLQNRRVGLLGYGAINQNIHRLLAPFDVTFAILRRRWNHGPAQLPTPAKKYAEGDLHPFLQDSDVLLIAVPLTSQTRQLIGSSELELLGPEGLVVNVARGDIIDETALFTALKNGGIAGAAIDTWYNYTPEPDQAGCKYPFTRPFHELPNVVLSPHRAASPLDDLPRWNAVIENIRRYAQGHTEFLNVVDLTREY